MKVLFIVTWYSAKDAAVIREGIFHYEMACALKKNCDVAIYFPFDNSLTEDFSDSIEHGIQVFRRNNRCGSVRRRIHYIADYRKIKRAFNFDVVHAHVAQGAGRVAFLWKLFFGSSYILTEHAPVEMMRLDTRKYRFVSNCVYSRSKFAVCVSSDLCNKLEVIFPKTKFEVIYNGVVSPSSLLKEDVLPVDGGHAVNCAIIAAFYDKEIKGYQFLLPAIQVLVGKEFDICLHICGGGEYLDFYKELAVSLGIADRCFFYGQVEKEKVYSVVSQMDFIVSASLYESAGVSAEEAMLLGKPLVVTKSGGVNSLVTNETAIIVDAGSSDALIAGIERMIQELPNFRFEKIQKYARENFDMEVICRKYIDLYTRGLV